MQITRMRQTTSAVISAVAVGALIPSGVAFASSTAAAAIAPAVTTCS